MATHPDLGYYDEGADLQDPAFYKASRAGFGKATILTPVAVRSKIFADLEDEKLWTRRWICIGSHHEIPNPGDLLPYTIGNHGIHVQREMDGLVGRFNLAQHGGCRVIPDQCQTGYKTRCSFTSCGYSRDRDAISGDELGDNTPAMRQFLGYRPERLLPVHVETCGPFLFVNLDNDATSLADQLGDAAAPLALDETLDWTNDERFWVEYEANWKLLAQAVMQRLNPAPKAKDGQKNAIVSSVKADPCGRTATIAWLFPNLFLARRDDCLVSIILQPTGLSTTLARVRIASPREFEKSDVEPWRARLDEAGVSATTRQEELERFGTPSRPGTTLDDLPPEEDRAAHMFQKYLIAQVLKKQEYHWAGPLYTGTVR